MSLFFRFNNAEPTSQQQVNYNVWILAAWQKTTMDDFWEKWHRFQAIASNVSPRRQFNQNFRLSRNFFSLKKQQ